MGCPAKKVTSGYSGSALMRDLDHALTLIEATVGATSRPVTLKMRLGWDERTINAPELARRAVDAGVCLITVHGRTRCQFYAGRADWDAVAAVRAEVKVPLIVNGDVTSLEEAEAALEASGADGVMIGRAAYGQPWLPGDLAREAGTGVRSTHSVATIIKRAIAHYRAIIEDHGPALGVRVARKHLGWYLDRAAAAGAAFGANMRAALMVEPNPAAVVARLAGIEPSPEAERLAA
jgi:nifR3 family TIM-barrel protein